MLSGRRLVAAVAAVAAAAMAVAAAALLIRWTAQQDLITLVLGAASIAALVALAVVLARARSAGDFDSSTVLILALGWLPNLAIAVVVMSGGLRRELDASRTLVPVLPGWYESGVYLGLAALIGISLALFAARLISGGLRVRVNAPVLLALLLWGLTWLASALDGGKVLSLSGMAMLACLLAATVLPRGRGACVGAAIFGVSLAIASAILATVRFDLASVECRDDCVLGAALTGVFPNENLLATALVATLPFVYLAFRGKLRIWLLLFVAGTAIATASRGAIAITVVVVAALLVLRPGLDQERPAPVRSTLAWLMLVGAVAAAALITTQPPGLDLDDRPLLWGVAADYIGESPAFGYGPAKWETLYTQTGELPLTAQHSTHNQLVDVLFRAGVVGLCVLAAMVVAMVRSAGRARMGLLIVLATIFLIGITERAWEIGAVDFISVSLIATLLLGSSRQTEAAPETPPRVVVKSTREPRPLASPVR